MFNLKLIAMKKKSFIANNVKIEIYFYVIFTNCLIYQIKINKKKYALKLFIAVQ